MIFKHTGCSLVILDPHPTSLNCRDFEFGWHRCVESPGISQVLQLLGSMWVPLIASPLLNNWYPLKSCHETGAHPPWETAICESQTCRPHILESKISLFNIFDGYQWLKHHFSSLIHWSKSEPSEVSTSAKAVFVAAARNWEAMWPWEPTRRRGLATELCRQNGDVTMKSKDLTRNNSD